MTDALSIGWTAGQAATQRTVYRRVLGFALIVQTVLALIAITWPRSGWRAPPGCLVLPRPAGCGCGVSCC